MESVGVFDSNEGFSPGSGLSAHELAEAGRPGVLARLAEVDRDIGVLQAERLRLLGRLGDEALFQAELNAAADPSRDADREQNLQWRSAALELAVAANIGTDTASRQLAEAWTLTQKCEVTLQAMEAGQISFGHAQTIAREVGDLDPLAAGAAQEALLPFASRLSAGLFRKKAREILDASDPERLHDRHARAYAGRHVVVDGARDGMASLTAFVDAADAAVLRAGLANAARQAKHLGDDRTHRQLEADLFVEILSGGQVIIEDSEGRLAAAQTLADLAPVTVELLVPASTAAGEDAAPGKIPRTGMIDPVKARELIAKAPSLRRILTDPITSAIVDFDRATYRVPAELKRMILLRDEHCRAPNCPRPPKELDHTIGYARGGTTSNRNLAGLCGNHHHLKHETPWQLYQHADGVLDWVSPNGRHRLTRPDVIMPAEPPPDPWGDGGDYATDAPF